MQFAPRTTSTQTHCPIMLTDMKSCFWGVLLALLLISCEQADDALTPPGSSPPVAVLTSGQANYVLRNFVQLFPETSAAYTIEEISDSAFQDQFQFVVDYEAEVVSNRVYWGKLQLQNRLPETEKKIEWVLTMSSTWTHLEVFTARQDGSWQAEENGTFTPYYQRAFVPTTEDNLVKLALPPGEPVTIYFRGFSEQASLPPTFTVYAQPLDNFYDKLVGEKVANAIFMGFLLMMFFYNLILYFFGRDRSFVFYSGYLLMVLIYSAYTAFDLVDWFSPILFREHPEYYGFFKLSIFVGMMCYLQFIRSFLDLGQLLPQWDRIFKFIIYLAFPLIVLNIIVSFASNFSYLIEDWVVLIYIAIVIMSGLLLLYPLYKTRDPKGYFVVGGIAVISLAFLLTLLSRVLDTSFSIFYLKIGAVIEVIIFSLGLAYRQRQQVQAREQADFALKESRLIQESKQLEADRLQELNEFKTRFYTNITHEFRTPLTVIMGMNENIKQHAKEKELIRRNSANLLRLINQLLDLSKIESGALALNLVCQDIIVYLQYLTESFYSAAAQKDIRLVFYAEEKEVVMDYDEEKIQQIVYNLLINALKFTPAKGRIVFHANRIEEEGQPYLQLKVQDSGRGIPPERLDRIFERFYQVDDEEHQQTGGTGIGLALTKELVDLMEGRISVESELGSGTAFTIYLPITTNAANVEGVQKVPPKNLVDEVATVAIPEESEVDEPTIDTLPELLIIEDNPDIVTYIKSILNGQYNFHTAVNGAIGIAQAQELIPDIIISDLIMPEKDGYEVCASLKQDERTSHIPIILLTAKSTQQDKIQGLQYGADAYLIKPFDKAELVVRLEQLVAMRQQLQKHYTAHAGTGDLAAGEPSLEDSFLAKLRDLIQAKLSDAAFGVPQLATASHLSQMQLYRKLKALTGKTPSQFIRSYRLQQGLLLLKKGTLTVSEVAYEVGFTDPSYFSRTFHQEFKRNPSSFLNN